MKHFRNTLLTWVLLACSTLVLYGQNEPVIIQAESGLFTPDDPPIFRILDEGSTRFVRVDGNFIPGITQTPGSDSRVISYTVTFPRAGTYELYARFRVGPAGFDDDSFYYGNGFGVKSATNPDDWILANGLSPVGHTTPTDIVTGGGPSGNGVWKWLKLSTFDGGEPPISFTVSEGNLTQTFQIGSRENGLDIDQLAFGFTGVFYTVSNLDNGEAGSTIPPPPPFTPTGPPIAQGKPKFLGNVYSNSQIPFFTNYWNQVTPENAGKWGSVEGTRDVMNWTQLDAAYELAKSNGFPFRFHVLIWGNQQPSWIENLPPAEQLEEIEEWFAAVAGRYPDLDFIEVVNEPLNDPPLKRNDADQGSGNYYEALGGAGATGWDWILTSFRLARRYFPNSKLMINEYSITNTASSARRYIEIINLLKAENLIDVIGVQGHAFSTRVPASVTLSNLNLLAETGLPIQVTEMDIDGPTDQVQLEDYQRIFPVFWEHPAVQGITLWGWKPGMWRTAQGAYLALENGAERPALVWLREYAGNNAPVIQPAQRFAIDAGVCNVIGTIAATDADENATLQNWQITGGTGAGIFALDATTGELSIANPSRIDFAGTDSYTLSVTVRDNFTASAPETITIDIPRKVYVCHRGRTLHISRNAVPAHLALGNCIGRCTAGDNTQSSLALNGIQVFPNPAREEINVTIAADGLNIRTVELLDLSGRVVMQATVTQQSGLVIPRGKLPAGMYLLRMRGDEVINQKIVLE
jgi:GH35 family endo-1,4-beta-xylanase